MHRPMLTLCLLFLAASGFGQEQKQDEPQFPKKEEIELVVSQAERAFDQYKQSVSMEANLPTSKQNPVDVGKDREVIQGSAKLISLLKKNPEAFHGVGGLLLLSMLDDASRNAALCSATGASDIAEGLLSKPDTKSAYQTLTIIQSCIDASTHLFTVSESVHALLVREMEAQQILNQQAQEALNICSATLNECNARIMKRSQKQR